MSVGTLTLALAPDWSLASWTVTVPTGGEAVTPLAKIPRVRERPLKNFIWSWDKNNGIRITKLKLVVKVTGM